MDPPETRGVRKRTMVPNTKSNNKSKSSKMGAQERKTDSDANEETELDHNQSPTYHDNGAYYKETSQSKRPLSDSESDSEGHVMIFEPEVPKDPLEDEKSWQIAVQVFIPYIIAGLGMVAAGMVLDKVQHWNVFKHVPEVFILVPALLGLKGNLEMTLASRLSTQANLGNMDSTKETISMVYGNLALTQAQAIVVGFLAAIFAMVLGWIPEGKFSVTDALLLSASSVLTASLASLVLGSVMIGVILFSRKYNINPDNVATPIAASLGDLTTLTVLSCVSNGLYKILGLSEEYDASDHEWWLCPLLLTFFLALVPVWCIVSHRNKYVHTVLYEGWTPVIGAMLISSAGGLILDFAVKNYPGIAVFQPVINGVGGNLVAVQASRISTSLHIHGKPGDLPAGVGGNLVAVQASRISTSLHIHGKPGDLPAGRPTGCPNPLVVFFGVDVTARTTRVLLMLVVPGQLVFMFIIKYMPAGHTSITPIFSLFYLTACVIQVVVLLYISVWMVHFLWRRECDPDNYSIPYLTAIGDLLGGFLLAICFAILGAIGDGDADVRD